MNSSGTLLRLEITFAIKLALTKLVDSSLKTAHIKIFRTFLRLSISSCLKKFKKDFI